MTKTSVVWDSINVLKATKNLELGVEGDYSCFYNNDISLRNGNIIFKYTKEELEEMKMCKNDILHFADNYCYAMTDDGVVKIKLRDYQRDILKNYHDNRFIVFLASRQIGKTITSAIFITWFLCFNYDKNVLIVANKYQTALEILDKVKTIIRHLPFYMKPGVISGGKTGMVFDNGCRIITQATTKTTAIGYTIHLLYADEFAHIHPNFLNSFYRSIYPTLSSSNISRMIITSTANGLNLFYQIYKNAIEGNNSFKPLRVDWWQVPGRDDEWKKREIKNLGSEELFNQEYGNQFISSNNSIIRSDDSKFFLKLSKSYVFKELYDVKLVPYEYKDLLWYNNFDPNKEWVDKDQFIISVDLSGGVGGDYTVFNIFKLKPYSVSKIKKMNLFENQLKDSDYFRLVQVGLFRSNKINITDASKILKMLVYDVFGVYNCSVILEMNYNGNYVLGVLSDSDDFDDSIFVKTKHKITNPSDKIGVNLNGGNKILYVELFKKNLIDKRIVITNDLTFEELRSFGIDVNGKYKGLSGSNDDIVMTMVNLSPYFDSYNMDSQVESYFKMIEPEIENAINNKINKDDNDDLSIYRFLNS